MSDVQVSSLQSWEQVGRWYDGLQRERVAPTNEIRAKAAELTRNAPDDLARIRAIYKYVSTDFRYIGVSFGIGRYQPHAAAEVLNNQYGDCKDKHTLLASLLAAVNIPAYPALISALHSPDTAVPSPSQFDHVITVVPRGKDLLWLDSTPEVAPAGFLVPPLRGKQALVIRGDKIAFETTPTTPPVPTQWTFKMEGTLDTEGTLQGKIEQSMRGDAEVLWRQKLRSLPRSQWKDLVQQISYGMGFAGDVSDVDVSSPEAIEDPLRISYSYARKKYPDWESRRIRVPAPEGLATPMEEDGKLPQQFWLSSPGELLFESRIEVPRDYSAEVPASMDLVRPFAEYHSSFSFQDHKLSGKFRIIIKKSEVIGNQVQEYKTFAEKASEDHDQFVSLASGQQNKSPQEAALAFQRRVWELPDSKDAKALQAEQDARAAAQSRNFQGFVDALNRAVQIDPKFTRAWVLLGQMQLGGRDKEAGLKAFRSAIQCDTRQPLPYKFLAYALMSLSRRTEAVAVWQDLAKVAPDDHDIATNLGSLLLLEKRYREAIPYLESAMKIFPDKEAVLGNLASAYLSNGDDEKAVAIFNKLLAKNPGPQTKNDIAYSLAVAGKKLNDALRYAQEAVREEEELTSKVQLDSLAFEDIARTRSLGAYWDTLGWVHFQLGNLKQAENFLYAAWTLEQQNVIGYHLGQVFEKEKRIREAANLYGVVASQNGRGGEDSDAVAGSKKAMARLHMPMETPRPGHVLVNQYSGELSNMRTTKLPRIAKEGSAEFFLLFGPGDKLESVRFIGGAEQFKPMEKTLGRYQFKIAFPENSSGKIVRKGILGCFSITGCSMVLLPMEDTRLN